MEASGNFSAASGRGHWLALFAEESKVRRSAALLPAWGLIRQPRSPERLGHRVAAGGPGIAQARTRLAGSGTFLRSCWGDFCVCCGRPRFRNLIEPHCQRDPTAFRVDLQHFDADDIARLRNFAWVLDVTVGHRGDVHQPVLVDPHIDEGAERGDVRHDTVKNHSGPQIIELFHALAEAHRLESRVWIASGFLEFPQHVDNGRHPEYGVSERLRRELAEYGRIPDHTLQLALGCREYAPHHGVGFRMYARRIKRIIAVADAQKSCRKLESLGSEPRHLVEDRAGAKRTVRLTVTDDAARQSFADAGHS